jgi:hypothetical protein
MLGGNEKKKRLGNDPGMHTGRGLNTVVTAGLTETVTFNQRLERDESLSLTCK